VPVLRPEASAPAGLWAGARWLTLLAVLAVVAVNAAGLWGIQVARQGLRDAARGSFEQEVRARATRLERRLSEIRADLAFVGATSSIARLDEVSEAGAPLARQAAESALLLFLRGNPEVVRISIRTRDGRPLVHVGRRGGVPVLWVSASPTGEEGAAVDPRRTRLIVRLPQGEPSEASVASVRLEGEADVAALLDSGEPLPSLQPPRCELRDASGSFLGRFPPGRLPQASDTPSSTELRAEGWSAAVPLRLTCRQEEAAVPAEPVFARYRTTLALNLGVMALALLLGGFAVQQARRRARLEARAAEEAHVRELERQLFHAERLSTVGRLAAGIAHELNNPLEGMANYLVLAREALARGDTDTGRRHLAGIKQGLDRAAGVVGQVLAHADPAKAPMSPCDLNAVLRETVEFVRTRHEFGHVELLLELTRELLVVRGSPVMLGQVAMNLVVNGCEAQPASGEVRIVSRREGGSAVVEFMDRGPGVAEADRRRIFEPFFSTKDSTGLGLAICHTIVSQHGGELSVEPRPGGGSLFRMRLPASEGQA
jgi:signal transduction histidine kinase